MSPLTLAEFRSKQAELALRAERKRQQWRDMRATQKALDLGKEVRALDLRAKEYADLIRVAEGMKP